MTLQLEDLLSLKKIEIEDSKVTNISILSVTEFKMQIKDEFIIVGLQKFDQYTQLNPITIRITDQNLKRKLFFYSKNRYKYRFVATSLLFSSAIKREANTIFITTNGLNDAKDILVNGKLYQGIGAIYTSEIENWDKLKTESHWVVAILTDSSLPITAKHFSFAFETTDLNSLLNFEYSLLNDKGELLQFADREDKVPALKFIIQII